MTADKWICPECGATDTSDSKPATRPDEPQIDKLMSAARNLLVLASKQFPPVYTCKIEISGPQGVEWALTTPLAAYRQSAPAPEPSRQARESQAVEAASRERIPPKPIKVSKAISNAYDSLSGDGF